LSRFPPPFFKHTGDKQQILLIMGQAAWRGKIIADVKRQKHQKRVDAQKKFSRIYDKKRTIGFKPREYINMNKFFCHLFMWRADWKLSKYAAAVYPVMCSRDNFEIYGGKGFQISRENIARLAGVSTNSVDRAIEELENRSMVSDGVHHPLLRREKVQEGERHYYIYEMGFIRSVEEGLTMLEWKDQYFTFHTCLIESGVWAALSFKAKLLYLVMRQEAYHDKEIYQSLESEFDYDGESYAKRLWDICDQPLSKLFRLAGMRVNYNAAKAAIEELEKHELVERMGDKKAIFRVFLRPKIRKNP